VVAVLARIGRATSAGAALRTGTALLCIATPLGIAIFALAGPLQKGWARRAGTPANLLGQTHFIAARRPAPATGASARGPLEQSFSASLAGSISQSNTGGGVIVELNLRLSGRVNGQMRVRMGGTPLDGGGLSLSGSQVDLTAAGMPSAQGGKILSLQGDRFLARVSDSAGSVVDVRANLVIDPNTNAVTGTVTGAPVGGAR
jgi:hypothetical protein